MRCSWPLYIWPSNKIYLDGEDITDLDITERSKKGIGFAFQQPPRFKGIKVRELLEISCGEKKVDTCDLLINVGLYANDYLDREVDSSHDGIHEFRVRKGARIKYVEKHFGEEEGTGKRILNPKTVLDVEEGAEGSRQHPEGYTGGAEQIQPDIPPQHVRPYEMHRTHTV